MNTYLSPASGTLPTWGGRSQFAYRCDGGVFFEYGNKRRLHVSAKQMTALQTTLGGQLLPVFGAEPSLDAWVKENIIGTRIASYLAPVLVAIGLAERSGSKLRIL
jgi:hypothetical protein